MNLRMFVEISSSSLSCRSLNYPKFFWIFLLVSLRCNCCLAFENVEKFLVPIDVSITRSHLSPESEVSLSSGKTRRLIRTQPLIMAVDLSILSSKDPSHRGEAGGGQANHRLLFTSPSSSSSQPSSSIHQERKAIQLPWGFPPLPEPAAVVQGPSTTGEQSSAHHNKASSRHDDNNNNKNHNRGLHTNEIEWPAFHPRNRLQAFDYDRLPIPLSNHEIMEMERHGANPIVEDALTDYLRDRHGSHYEDMDLDDETEADDEEEDPFYPYWSDDEEEQANYIIPVANKKSSQEALATKTSKRAKAPSWVPLPSAKGDFWRLAHKLRIDKGRRKIKRSPGWSSARRSGTDKYILGTKTDSLTGRPARVQKH